MCRCGRASGKSPGNEVVMRSKETDTRAVTQGIHKLRGTGTRVNIVSSASIRSRKRRWPGFLSTVS